MRNKKIFRILGITALIFLLLIFVLSIFYREHFQLTMEGNVENYGLFALFTIVLLLEIIPQYISPHLIMFNAWIIGLPLFRLTIFAILGHVFASIIGFYLGKKYGLGLVEKFYNKKEISYISHKMDLYGKWVVFLSAFFPVPYIPIIFGSLNLSWKKFTFFGIIPRAISFALLGLGIYVFLI